ncbi:hypothetical protein, partial [Rhodococcus sp. IEGM 1379]|uniref:hypothetical protein n=1 Tax=Rhodococcus sp. IEGM 1379 TaxID=3047086 RepID=UPI0024B709EE
CWLVRSSWEHCSAPRRSLRSDSGYATLPAPQVVDGHSFLYRNTPARSSQVLLSVAIHNLAKPKIDSAYIPE